MPDIKTNVSNMLDMLVAGGIDFDLKIWTKCAEIKPSAQRTWVRGISGQFGFQPDEDAILKVEDRVRLFIKKVAVPQVARLLAKGYEVRIIPSPARQGPATVATSETLEELLQFASRWVIATQSDFKRGISLTVTTNEAE
jgi:hypothetical protein